MGAHTSEDAASRDVMDSLRRIVQVLRESSRRAEQQLGISGAQLFVLAKLAEAPSQSLNELSARTHTHQSSVSTVVGRLVERGLVSRQRSTRDARRLELLLTPRGRRLADSSPGAVQDRLIRTIQELPPRARRQLAMLLRSVVSGMDAPDYRPRMFFDDDGRSMRSRNA
jgi:MarR family transcriptional regulator, lower aerobic nicotinate degradation pathway regulator